MHEALIAEPCGIRGHGGDIIEAYYAKPLGSDPVPGVVFLHHSPGFDDWCKQAIRDVASRGYAVLGPHLFSRSGPGRWDDVAAAARARGGNGMPDEQVLGDIQGSIAFLRSQPNTNGKVAALGFCSGGRQAYMAACKLTGLDAIVDAWGGNVYPDPELRKGDPAAYGADFTEHLSCPILGIFGNDDSNPSHAEVNRTEELLKQHHKTYEFHRYDGAGHAFFCTDRPMYRVSQAVDGWQKVFAFFDKYLASTTAPDWATRRQG